MACMAVKGVKHTCVGSLTLPCLTWAYQIKLKFKVCVCVSHSYKSCRIFISSHHKCLGSGERWKL